MMRKTVVALLLASMLLGSFGAALADPTDSTSPADTTGPADTAGTNANDIVIKYGENSDNVILLQMRLQDLGYYDYKITGFFGSFTKLALIDFQKTNGLAADGVAGSDTLNKMYSNAAKRSPVIDVNPPPKPKPVSHKTGAYLDWFTTVRYMWKMGMQCKVYDFDTNISYTMVRVGGINHADVAPATKADNANFIKSYTVHGGSYPNWDRRAVVVIIGGKPVAGSTNGFPHGSTGIKGNGMIDPTDGSVGQVCIHFLNSRNHVHNMIDPSHQYEVRRAAHLPVGAKPSMSDND